MAVLTTQQVLQTGTTPAFSSAAAGGDKVTPGDNVWLIVKNAGGSPITVTVDCVTPSNYGADGDLVVTVPATTGEKWIGPLPAQRFMASDGYVNVAYSGVTSVTVATWKV